MDPFLQKKKKKKKKKKEKIYKNYCKGLIMLEVQSLENLPKKLGIFSVKFS
jgi:hypothetical protein